jgi:hypothetical protein
VSDKQLKKIKYDGGALEVTLAYVNDDAEYKSTVKSLGGVHPDLPLALQALVEHVRNILVLPDYWCAGAIRVTGLAFSYRDGDLNGAVISCEVGLTTCNAPFCFSTPHLPFDSDSGESEIPRDAIDPIMAVVEEVNAYLAGKRAQSELNFGEAA